MEVFFSNGSTTFHVLSRDLLARQKVCNSDTGQSLLEQNTAGLLSFDFSLQQYIVSNFIAFKGSYLSGIASD